MGPEGPRGKSPEQHLEGGDMASPCRAHQPERKLWPCLSPHSRVQSTSSGGICLKVLSSSWNLFPFSFEGDRGGQLGTEWEPKPCSYPEGHEEGGVWTSGFQSSLSLFLDKPAQPKAGPPLPLPRLCMPCPHAAIPAPLFLGFSGGNHLFETSSWPSPSGLDTLLEWGNQQNSFLSDVWSQPFSFSLAMADLGFPRLYTRDRSP